ncbi:type II secretion system protein [Pseudoalteromonas ruthenica]|uniref:Type II secretion system protein n=1 Tax=Pseudoalteromonas ruthenica TaxID=151081 RepID=A0A5S3Z1M1_9GAMM|nr:type II secretion system protein [Pseudoalteromonas ruthenica]TMP86179.1 type II secretion system protein [Pseudoalteromonas ruthenica]
MNNRGFTLVELIITIILIGVLAVTAIPRFLGSNNEDVYTLRDRTLAMIRSIQLQAMHNLNSNNCVKITTTLVAPPANQNCANPISTAFDDYLVVDSTGTDITFTTTDNNGGSFNSLSFNHLGQPDINCAKTCRVQVGNQAVCISGEGALYGC